MSWEDVRARLAATLGGGSVGNADAAEWIRESLERCYDVQDESELDPVTRADALRRIMVPVGLLQGDDLAVVIGTRRIVADAFARSRAGELNGPPWRVDPTEDLPTRQEWSARADFADGPCAREVEAG